MNPKGQVTIFVIIAILVVAVVLLFLFLRGNNNINPDGGPQENPELFLDSCLKEPIRDSLQSILDQGGYIDPELYGTFLFPDEEVPTKVSYLCYTNEYSLPCVNQAPILLGSVEYEVYNNIKEDVWTCISELGKRYESEGYGVVVKNPIGNFQVHLEPKRIIINMDAEITLSKADQTITQRDFKAKYSTRIYDLLGVVQEAINKKANSVDCKFNYVNYQTLYTQFDIERFVTVNETEIFRIEHKDSHEIFNFAMRGCVIEPGI